HQRQPCALPDENGRLCTSPSASPARFRRRRCIRGMPTKENNQTEDGQLKRLDNALFLAYLHGDEETLGKLLNVLGTIAIRIVEARRFRGREHCIGGWSAEDIVSEATIRFLKAVRSRRLKQVSFVGYFLRIVDNRFIDLCRCERRRPALDP